MKLFLQNQEISEREILLAPLKGMARAIGLIELAWAVRECDSLRAIKFADEAEALLANEENASADLRDMHARLLLIRGTVYWLHVDLHAAEKCANSAIAAFQFLSDGLGVGDAKWLLASIWEDRGFISVRDRYLESMIEDYRGCFDLVRLHAGLARSIERTCYRNSKISADRLEQFFDEDIKYSPIVSAWLSSARGTVAAHSGRAGQAIKFYMLAHEAALQSAQVRQAVLAATNVADNFAVLSDLEAALEWNERAVVLARSSNYQSIVGVALMQKGNVLRLLARTDAAKAALSESLQLMNGLQLSYRYALNLQYLGELSLSIGEYAKALDYFCQAKENKSVLWEAAFVLLCWRGEATALCHLGRFEEASEKVRSTLELAKQVGNPAEEIKVLQICAQLASLEATSMVADKPSVEVALSFLLQAFDVAANYDGYALPFDLLDEIAKNYAAKLDFERAYHFAILAEAARDNGQIVRARDRAIAMQAHDEMRQIRDESEKMRQLALVESQRVIALQEASATLETLSVIGREITASLNTEAVFDALYRHVHQLLDTSSFVVFLIDVETHQLVLEFGMEAGQKLSNHRFSMDDRESLFVQCVRERREILVHFESAREVPYTVAGTLPTLSKLYDPLMVGDSVLGVMSIQSVNSFAYGERECSIFHTLCAYGAIGLGNARAYNAAQSARNQANVALIELRQAQESLRLSEERWAFALEGSGDGVWDWDIAKDEILLSKRWKTMLGYEEHEIGNQINEWFSRIHPDDFISVMENVKANMDGRLSNSSNEHRVQCKDGGFLWILERGMVVQRDDQGQALRMVGTSTDISERRQIERMKSEFISTVSHELRTPLTAIRGSLGLLEGGVLGELPPKALNLIKIANESCQRLVFLVNDILDMDKLEAGKMLILSEKINLIEIVKQAIEANSAFAATYHVSFQLSQPRDLIQAIVKSDSNRLMQVLTNLLSNATKFSTRDGTVEIRILSEGSFFRVEVVDHGIGIPDEFKHRIFGAFSQAGNVNTRQQGGTGLGLNICKKLVVLMGGEIGYISEVGVGTTFWFTVPVWTEGSAESSKTE